MSADAPGQDRPCPYPEPRGALLLHGAALTIVGIVAAALILLDEKLAAIAWILSGLAAGQVLLVRTFARRRHACQIEGVAQALLSVLDAQGIALGEQQRELAGLQAVMSEPGAVRDALATQTAPNLSVLVERLAQAESSLPDMLPYTRERLAELRRLAAQTQARVETMSHDISRKAD